MKEDAVVAAASWASLVEVDVQLSRDGGFVLYHHYTLPDGRWVHETDRADCMAVLADSSPGGPAPMDMDAVMALAVDLDVGLCLDLKSGMAGEHAIHRHLIHWFHSSLPSGRRVHISDWDHEGLQIIKNAHPQVTVRGAVRGRLADPVSVARGTTLDGLNLAWDCTRPSDVAQLQEHGFLVAFFGGWSDRYLPYARKCGVDVVITDDPPPDL